MALDYRLIIVEKDGQLEKESQDRFGREGVLGLSALPKHPTLLYPGITELSEWSVRDFYGAITMKV